MDRGVEEYVEVYVLKRKLLNFLKLIYFFVASGIYNNGFCHVNKKKNEKEC